MILAGIIFLGVLSGGIGLWAYYKTAKDCYDQDREARQKNRPPTAGN